MMDERRSPSIRRDVNDMIRGPDGRVAESKFWANIFKGLMCYVFVQNAVEIIKDWMVLAVFVTALLAPELLKKLMTMRLGGVVAKEGK